MTFPAQNCYTFMGVQMYQAWSDLNIWESFFNEHPLKAFVELGTGGGGMSLYLAMQCAQRGAEFVTLDQWKWMDFSLPVTALLGMERKYKQANLWEKGGDLVRAFLADRSHAPLLLFCDNGDKRREVRTFGPCLGAGDFMAVHDWDVEIGTADIPPERYVPLDYAGALMTRWFQVR